jgi:hypothetical protein
VLAPILLAVACHALAPSAPAWRAIDAQYAKIAEASRTKNLDALAALYDPQFRVTGPNDAHLDYKQSLEYSRAACGRAGRWRSESHGDTTPPPCRTRRGSAARTAGSA